MKHFKFRITDLMRPRLGLWFLFLFLAATAAALFLPWWVILLPVAAVLVYGAIRPQRAVQALVPLLVFSVGFLHVLALPDLADEARYGVELNGVVREASCSDRVGSVVVDHAVIRDGDTVISAERVLVSPVAPGLEPGDVISVSGSAFGIWQTPENPGELSYELSNRADGISHTFSAGVVKVTGHEDRLNTTVFRLRKVLKTRIDAVMPDEDVASVMLAMITGDRQVLSDETSDAFSASGVSHLLAVSGLHVGILLSLLSVLLFLNKRFRWVKLAVITVFLLFYCCFTGFAPSILRASLMAFLLSLTAALGWRYDPLNALGWAGTAILLVNPLRMFDLSFQLSFSATFGIIAFGPSAGKRLSRIPAALRLTLAASAGTLPMVWHVFASQPFLLLLANLLLVPLATLALSLLVILLLPSFIFPELTFLATPAYYPAYLLLSVCRLLAKGPQLVLRPLPAAAAVVLLGFLLFFSRFVLVKHKRAVAAVLTVILMFLLVGTALTENNRVTVTVPSVSSGKLPVIVTDPEGDVLVSPTGDAALARYLSHYTGRLNAVFLLSQEEADAYAEVADVHPAETVYVNSGVIYPGPTVPLIDRTEHPLRLCLLRYENGGLILYSQSRRLLLSGTADFAVDLAIGDQENAALKITRYGSCDSGTVFPTKSYGCVRCRVARRGLTVIPFHEAKS